MIELFLMWIFTFMFGFFTALLVVSRPPRGGAPSPSPPDSVPRSAYSAGDVRTLIVTVKMMLDAGKSVNEIVGMLVNVEEDEPE